MAAACDLEEDVHLERNQSRDSTNNNESIGESCKDLLSVFPERGLERYLLKNGHRTGLPGKTFKPSTCEALKQVKTFLPIMEKAQQELINDDLNIENVNEDKPYINMDLQLVEFEDSESSTESESESECNGSDGSSGDEFHIGEVTTRNFVITKTSDGGEKPLIEDVT